MAAAAALTSCDDKVLVKFQDGSKVMAYPEEVEYRYGDTVTVYSINNTSWHIQDGIRKNSMEIDSVKYEGKWHHNMTIYSTGVIANPRAL